MDSYSSSDQTNTNIAHEVEEQKVDLGHEFISQILVDSNKESPSPKQTLGFNELYGQFAQPFVTTQGFITLFVSNDIRVDINTNLSICVTTPQLKASVDALGENIGVIHPYGRVYKESDNCHIESGIHLAKMSGRGITFTSLKRTLIYLVDISGCKTTADRFRPLNYDFVANVFHANPLAFDYALPMAYAELYRHRHEVSEDGTDNIWFIAGIRIRHNFKTGDLMITKSYGKIVIHISPNKNQMKITSPHLRIMANYDPDCYLQVIKPHQRDEQRIVSGAEHFRVKYGSQKAGFDASDQLVLM